MAMRDCEMQSFFSSQVMIREKASGMGLPVTLLRMMSVW